MSIVFHFFVIVMLADGQMYYDDWAFTSVSDCNEKHQRIEKIVNDASESEFRSFYLGKCERIVLPARS